MKKFAYLIPFAVLATFLFLADGRAEARGLGHVRDIMTVSWPNATSSHTFEFVATVDIPPAGRIVLEPEAGRYEILASLDFEDLDFALAANMGGPYIDRTVASASSAVADGVSVTSGYSGSIELVLNSTAGIMSGQAVRIEIGAAADYEAAGEDAIKNPAVPGAYNWRLLLYDELGALVGSAEYPLDYIIEPVALTGKQYKMRSNGSPQGYLAYGTVETYLSLTTNYLADCRFASSSGVDYYSMAGSFSYTGGNFHSVHLTGLTTGTYNYYIRCLDIYNVPDLDDYLISFTIKAQGEGEGDGEGENEGDGTGSGSGGGGAGSGSGGGFGLDTGSGSGENLPYPPLPGSPSVEIFGWSYPRSQVTVLKDGVEAKTATADTAAKFAVSLTDLSEGVYTFGIRAQDSEGRKSITYSSTFWIKEGTKSVVSDIILPPTIEASSLEVMPGDVLRLTGQTVPSSTVEAWLYPDKNNLVESEIVKKFAVSAENGHYEAVFTTSGIEEGVYRLKARTALTGVGTSEFGDVIRVGIGEEVPAASCAGADLNGDGRVNITDFSILLYWWGSADPCADQNGDGKVDLIDFSIMMFYWSG